MKSANDQTGFDYHISFFSNGNTTVFNGGRQAAELQESWFITFIRFLSSRGIDPMRCNFMLPDGRIAKLFEIEDGYNWEIK